MKRLRNAAIVLATIACVGLAWDSAGAGAGSFGKSCGGFKPETRTMCWRNLL
jgi:hypothetical protein